MKTIEIQSKRNTRT